MLKLTRLGPSLPLGLLACLLAAIPAAAQTTPSPSAGGARDFDFLVGEWSVHHRRLDPGTGQWVAFDGTCSHRQVLGGLGNIEEHLLDAPSGAYRAIGLRAFDPRSGEWAIWWLDGRYPSGPVGPPVTGRFQNGVGTFVSDYTQDGKAMRVRFLWSHITTTSARWEQSTSSDGGKTWAPNWVMEFERAAAQPAKSSVKGAPAGGFDFLDGEWKVRHRYLRAKDGRTTWAEATGTATHRAALAGRANVEEHTIQAAGGAYSALALRSFDPTSGEWSIWWLDGRSPHGALDPAVKGRLGREGGTFLGDTSIDGRPVRVRFIWSGIAGPGPRWEQAYSYDGGVSWETNWIMEFSRPDGRRPAS